MLLDDENPFLSEQVDVFIAEHASSAAYAGRLPVGASWSMWRKPQVTASERSAREPPVTTTEIRAAANQGRAVPGTYVDATPTLSFTLDGEFGPRVVSELEVK